MSIRRDLRALDLTPEGFFDLAGSDPELLNSGRITDPAPEHTPLFRWLAAALQRLEAFMRARGGKSLRFLIRFFWGALAAVAVFLLVGPIINKPLDFDDVIASADIDEVDWIARDARIDYAVGRDDDGGFEATVSERYTADFRNGPEPRIERVIVTEFEGHDVEFELHAATIDGEPAETEIVRRATTTGIELRRADGEDLSGEQEVVVEYELHHLISQEVDEATGRTVDRWSWPLFAPTWPQGTKGIEVSLTLAPELDDALVRAPRASVGWLLAAGNVRLDAEARTAEGVRYAFENDDSLPPNSDIGLELDFDAGTFSAPPTTALFWWQTYGPLIPMAVLAGIALCALAARRVVWADSAGDPWYLPRFEQPDDLDPELAASLLERPAHGELIGAMMRGGRFERGDAGRGDAGRRRKGKAKKQAAQSPEARDRWLREVARAGRRAGRIGNFLARSRTAGAWAKRDDVVERKLRWVPDSYLRDTFLFAPMAITLLQWGLLRQLSAQEILSAVWWPLAFVLVSTVLAVVAIRAVARPRPLTRAGALAVQQLKGIDVWARGTRLLARGPVDDPIMPYAMLFEPARTAGDAATALVERETGDRAAANGWRTGGFISIPALLALFASVAVLAGSIVLVSTQPAPYAEDVEPITWGHELPGTLYTQVRGMEIDARLERGADGQARIDVVEHLDVEFDDTGARVPQFAREWPAERLGQPLGLEFEALRVDGREAPVAEKPQARTGSLAVVTQLQEVLSGAHEVEVAYSLDAAAVAAPNGQSTVEQVRWTAWYSFWADQYYVNQSNPFDGEATVRPLRVSFEIAPDLAEELSDGGWIGYDGERDRVPFEDGNWYEPWVRESSTSTYDHKSYDLRVGSERKLDDGSLRVDLDFEQIESVEVGDAEVGDAETGDAEAGDAEAGDVEGTGRFAVDVRLNESLSKYDVSLNSDLGVRLDFPAGTFRGVDPQAYEDYRVARGLPFALVLGFAGLVFAAAVGSAIAASRARRGANASHRTVGMIAVPLLAIAQSIVFCWAIMSMPGGSSEGWVAIVAGAIMWIAVVAGVIVVGKHSHDLDVRGAAGTDSRPGTDAQENGGHD